MKPQALARSGLSASEIFPLPFSRRDSSPGLCYHGGKKIAAVGGMGGTSLGEGEAVDGSPAEGAARVGHPIFPGGSAVRGEDRRWGGPLRPGLRGGGRRGGRRHRRAAGLRHGSRPLPGLLRRPHPAGLRHPHRRRHDGPAGDEARGEAGLCPGQRRRDVPGGERHLGPAVGGPGGGSSPLPPDGGACRPLRLGLCAPASEKTAGRGGSPLPGADAPGRPGGGGAGGTESWRRGGHGSGNPHRLAAGDRRRPGDRPPGRLPPGLLRRRRTAPRRRLCPYRPPLRTSRPRAPEPPGPCPGGGPRRGGAAAPDPRGGGTGPPGGGGPGRPPLPGPAREALWRQAPGGGAPGGLRRPDRGDAQAPPGRGGGLPGPLREPGPHPGPGPGGEPRRSF